MSTGLVALVALLFVVPSTSGAIAASPEATGPVTGGGGVPVIAGSTSFPLDELGYVQSEFLLEGTAVAYAPTAPLTNDGKWSVAPTAPADFTTRVVVNRPADDADFNGTVYVEWLNVSGGADAWPDWTLTHVEQVRRGYAYVGVSAQAVGLNATKASDPVRYASLLHPGDSYSYDMFSQAGQAVRDDSDLLLGGLVPQRILAIGESQSAARLVTYLNAAHPLVEVYDGFLVHSRAVASNLTQDPLPLVTPPPPTMIRDDLDVPVLNLQTETDVRGLPARQPDSDVFRLWEVAGSAHYDIYGLVVGGGDRGGAASVAEWFDFMRNPTAQPSPSFTCGAPVNSGPQTFVLRAAASALDAWVASGTPPASAPRWEVTSVDPAQYVLDANGNVVGGIRTPAVDAPVATLSGLGQVAADFCRLFGTTVPLTNEQLEALHGDHAGFVSAWNEATTAAVDAGHVLPEDAHLLRLAAARSDVLGGPVRWAEHGDAEGVPWVAQHIDGDGVLVDLTGTLRDGDDDDMYAVCVADPGSFTARVSGSVDVQAFLFDADGRGIVANDDESAASTSAWLPLGSAGASPGLRYLAVSGRGNEPVANPGGLFDDRKVGPAGPGPGAGLGVRRWSSHGATGPGTYAIELTGVRTCP